MEQVSISKYRRWIVVLAAVITMALVSVYEYSWSLYVVPLSKAFHVPSTSAALSLTYTVYIVIQALSMWLSGRYADKHGPKYIAMVAGILTGLGYIGSAYVNSLSMLYLTYGIGSIGVGIIYGTAINAAIKWFPDIRGTVSGLIVLGFGSGSFAISPLINYIIHQYGYQSAFLYIGIVQLIVITSLAYFLEYPPSGWQPPGWNPEEAEKKRKFIKRSTHDFTFSEMVKTWQWWVIYISFILIAGAGLSIIGHLVSYGTTLGFAIAAVIAVYLFPLANGVGRLFAGWVSDIIGRPYSMLTFFVISGLSMIAVRYSGNSDVFVLLIILIAFTWGPLFSLFPSAVGDYFGPKYSGGNYGFTYTAKAIGGIFAGYGAAVLFTDIGIGSTLLITGLMAIIAGLLAITLKAPKAPKSS